MSDISWRSGGVCVYFNAGAERRARFQAGCGELFSRLTMADTIDNAADALAGAATDLLVLDLNGYARPGAAAAVGTLIANRAGAPVLLLCGYEQSAWLPELMAFGSFDYLICPVLDDEVRQAIRQALATPVDAAAAMRQRLFDKEGELRDLVSLQRGVQYALGSIDDIGVMAANICMAWCGFPGVCHASLLYLKSHGDLHLIAQEPRQGVNPGLDLAGLLGHTDHLLQSPLREVFPPLMAASTGRLVLLDAPEKTGDPELAMRLHDRYVRMVLALPLRSEAGQADMGALCVMFDRHLTLSREQFASFANLAQFVSLGLGMSELKHRNDELSGQLSQLSTVDTLTGAANRRAGEAMLDNELRRARRYGLPLAVMSFEVCSFRSLNDIYGHPLGDAALRLAADTVLRRLRASDLLARMRGQEFVIIATHTGAADALLLAEKLRVAIAGADLPACDNVSISLAIAEAAPEEGVDTLLDRLDAALQRAKRAGPNHIELADGVKSVIWTRPGP
nr:GGDEF domain-containing protein [uncultured Duganella sp.]